jgi:hypothetical protein
MHHHNKKELLGTLDSYHRELIGPFLPQLPAPVLRQVVDAIEHVRGRVFDELQFVDELVRAAAKATREAADNGRDAEFVARKSRDAIRAVVDRHELPPDDEGDDGWK